MRTFFPPVIRDLPRFHPDDHPVMKAALRFYRPDPRGINVWIVKDEHVSPSLPKFGFGDHPVLEVLEDLYIGGHYYQVTDERALELEALGLYVLPAPTPEQPGPPVPGVPTPTVPTPTVPTTPTPTNPTPTPTPITDETWQDVLNHYQSWADLMSKHASWKDLLD